MSMRGNCGCGNIQVEWHTVDFSVVPRACQCEYCLTRGAAYVSKSGTAVNVLVHKANQHRIARQGSGSARFHECASCGDVVVVTAEIDGDIYGALNALCMKNTLGFPVAVTVDFTDHSVEQKRDRWRRNWCCPVTITGPDGAVILTGVSESTSTKEHV